MIENYARLPLFYYPYLKYLYCNQTKENTHGSMKFLHKSPAFASKPNAVLIHGF